MFNNQIIIFKTRARNNNIKGNTGDNNRAIKQIKSGAIIKTLGAVNKISEARVFIIKRLFDI